MKHVDLITGAVRVGYHQSRPDDVEGGVDVHGIGIPERDHVYIVLVPEVAPHPVNTERVGHLAVCMLCAYIHVQPEHSTILYPALPNKPTIFKAKVHTHNPNSKTTYLYIYHTIVI